jgi:drug/metabolite transporter (DMT)-like permease
MQARFLWLVAIWGCSFLFIKIGLEALAPLQVVLGRLGFGAMALLALAAIRRAPLPREPRLWGHMAIAATLLNTVPFALMAYAEQRIPSAMASICNATTPLFTVFVAILALPDERPSWMRSAGLVLGFAGVAVVFGVWDGSAARVDRLGIALVLAAAACYGLGGVYLRRYLSATRYSGVALSAGQMLIGAVQLALVVPFATSMPAHVPAHVIAAIVALGALGTGIAYVLNYDLVRGAGATLASTVTYCIPLVSIGVVVLGERLVWNAPVGAAIILAGAMLSRRRQPALPTCQLEPPAPAARVSWMRGLG